MSTILDGVVIGGAGGAIAGLTVYGVQYIREKVKNVLDTKNVYDWLISNTSDERGKQFRSTRAISSWCNLTEDRTRFICSHSKKIYLSTGEREDLWSVYIRSASERGDDEPTVRSL